MCKWFLTILSLGAPVCWYLPFTVSVIATSFFFYCNLYYFFFSVVLRYLVVNFVSRFIQNIVNCCKLAPSLAFEQALLFGQAKGASRERASLRASSAIRGFAARSRVLARLV